MFLTSVSINRWNQNLTKCRILLKCAGTQFSSWKKDVLSPQSGSIILERTLRTSVDALVEWFSVVVVESLSHVWLFATPWTVAGQAVCPWDFPGKNTGVGCHSLLQGVFPTQGSNWHLLHCRRILYHWAAREAHMSSQAIVIVPAGRQWYNKPVSLLTFYVKGKLNQPTKWRAKKSGVSFLCYLSSCLCSIMKQGRQDCLCCLYVLSCSLVIILPWVILWWFQWKIFISILCICSVTIHYLLCARHCSRHCGYNKE